MDIKGYGMKMAYEINQYVYVIVENGVWTINAFNPNNFRPNDNISWGNGGATTAYTSKSGVRSGETLFAIELANMYPDIENASIFMIINAGNCVAVAYTPDKTEPLVVGADTPDIIIDENGRAMFDESNCTIYDSYGFTETGIQVGTYPAISEEEKTYRRTIAYFASLCQRSSTLENNTDTFLTYTDAEGYGMKQNPDANQYVYITVENSIWTVNAFNPDNFKSNDDISWGNEGTATADMQWRNATSGETLLAIKLARTYQDIENASIFMIINSGNYVVAAYTPDKTEPLVVGVDIDENGRAMFDESNCTIMMI